MADRQMQAIAKEFNYSETSFVRRPSSAQHTAEIRIFTPSTEVPFRPDLTWASERIVSALQGQRCSPTATASGALGPCSPDRRQRTAVPGTPPRARRRRSGS
jgi:PhzF family phenazine biosynthesis protein